MAQLPPPVHGAALRNKSLLDSEIINSSFRIHSLPLKFIDNMKDLGKFSFRKLMLMLRHCYRMSWILLTKKIDLVYFTMSPSGGAFYRDILFMCIVKLARKKCILHFRVKGIKKTGNSSIGRRLVRFAFKGSHIVCLSRHHLTDLEDFVEGRRFIVPNGIRVEASFLHLADKYSFQAGSPIKILFLSNLSTKKGVPDLIEALGRLKARSYDFRAHFVGGDWDLSKPEVERLIREAGLENHAFVEGPKYGEEKFSFIANADLFVFPTYFELFPGVILEAMQFGKAIVSTTEGSIPDIIDHHKNGILVEPRNVDQLTNAIAFMIDNPGKRIEMADSAKEKFFQEFTLRKFEEKMCEIFREVTT